MTTKPTQDINTGGLIKKTYSVYGIPIPIVIICISLCIAWTIMLANNLSILVTTFTHFFGPYSAEIVFNLLFLACSIFFVWKMKLAGRILVLIWSILNLVGNFLTLSLVLEMNNSDSFNQIFPVTHPSEFIFPIFFLFGLLYYINRKSVRMLFRNN